MTVLDENIIESQAQLLRSWRIPFRQIGQSVARQGMKDDEIIPLLHSLRQPTFFTRDLRFYERETPHAGYCIVTLAVGQNEVASFARARSTGLVRALRPARRAGSSARHQTRKDG